MRRVLPVLLLLLGSMPHASAARGSDVRKACRAFIERVAPRQGVHYRSLVLVPLVAKSKTPTGTIKLLEKERAWTPVGDLTARGEARLQPGKSTQAASQAACLLPSGLLMKRGVDERLVRHPLLASPAPRGRHSHRRAGPARRRRGPQGDFETRHVRAYRSAGVPPGPL